MAVCGGCLVSSAGWRALGCHYTKFRWFFFLLPGAFLAQFCAAQGLVMARHGSTAGLLAERPEGSDGTA